MRKIPNSLNSKVIGYDMATSWVILYGKDGTKRRYDVANFGTVKLAMIKAFVLSGLADALWNGHVDFIV